MNVQAQNLPGDAIARAYNSSPGITIGNVSANANISGTLSNLQAVARVQAPTATYPTTGRVVVAQQGENIVLPNAVLNVAGGTITAQGQLAQQRWQGVVNTSQIQLNRFSPQLRGRLNSNIQLAGTTESFQLADIRATGQIRLSQGVALLAQPLTAQFQWNGDQIIVENASTPGLNANGAIAIQPQD